MYKIPAKTLFMGKNLVFVPECHSTNIVAYELGQKTDYAEGTVVITNHQTAGKGQRDSQWLAEPGKNLTLSVILNPTFLLPKNQFLLNMAISLGVRDYLIQETSGDDVKVKWPNDILVKEKKICGILIENQIQGNAFSHSIIGIGLNINQKVFHGIEATSLQLINSNEYNLTDCLNQLLWLVEVRYMMLKQGQEEKIRNEYLSAMFAINELRFFRSTDRSFKGSITGVDEYGCLIVNTDRGQEKFNTKEIRLEL